MRAYLTVFISTAIVSVLIVGVLWYLKDQRDNDPSLFMSSSEAREELNLLLAANQPSGADGMDALTTLYNDASAILQAADTAYFQAADDSRSTGLFDGFFPSESLMLLYTRSNLPTPVAATARTILDQLDSEGITEQVIAMNTYDRFLHQYSESGPITSFDQSMPKRRIASKALDSMQWNALNQGDYETWRQLVQASLKVNEAEANRLLFVNQTMGVAFDIGLLRSIRLGILEISDIPLAEIEWLQHTLENRPSGPSPFDVLKAERVFILSEPDLTAGSLREHIGNRSVRTFIATVEEMFDDLLAVENTIEAFRQAGGDPDLYWSYLMDRTPAYSDDIDPLDGLANTMSRPFAMTVRRESLFQGTALVVAIERYRRHHQSLPLSLDDLAPLFIEKVPTDALSGQPFVFRQLDGEGLGYILYSIGENAIDEDGERQFNIFPDAPLADDVLFTDVREDYSSMDDMNSSGSDDPSVEVDFGFGGDQ